MSVITRILFAAESRPVGGGGEEDPVFLTSEQRTSPHGVLETVGGRVLRISLPRGSELNEGDVLADVDGTVVVVRAAEEALFSVSPETALMWGVAGFHLGNLHRPVRFTETAMMTPADAKVADVLRDAGLAFDSVTAPFVGRRFGSYAGHDHGDDHGDDHHHEH